MERIYQQKYLQWVCNQHPIGKDEYRKGVCGRAVEACLETLDMTQEFYGWKLQELETWKKNRVNWCKT